MLYRYAPTSGHNDETRKVSGFKYSKVGWTMFAHSGPLDLRALKPEHIHFGDIVHALGQINRFVGQTRRPISVVWRSLLVAELVRFEHFDTQLEALLHAAAEAYVGDWISPLYGMVDEGIQGLKERIQETAFAAAGLPDRNALLSKPVRQADRLMTRYEAESACGYGRVVSWHEPLTGPERERVETAFKGIGSPSQRQPEQEFLHWRFLHRCEELLADDVPLRRTLDEAKHVYRDDVDPRESIGTRRSGDLAASGTLHFGVRGKAHADSRQPEDQRPRGGRLLRVVLVGRHRVVREAIARGSLCTEFGPPLSDDEKAIEALGRELGH